MEPRGFGDVAEQLRRSTVRVLSGRHGEQGSGSGVIWTSDGTVITNAHVARDRAMQVELWDGRSFPAEVESRDDRRDLAKLKLKTFGLPAAPTRDSSSLRPGELVLAVGNPLGFIGALTTGVVHALGPVQGLGRKPWVQAAIRLAPGNSGGPLADAQGRVVGINTMIIAGGVALAVPGNAAVDFLKNGSRPGLGVTVRPVAIAPRAVGLLVLEVASNSPAESASLLTGDVLVGAGNRRFQSVDDLGDAIEQAPDGVLSLRFLRGDRRVEREVTARLVTHRREAAA